MENHPSRHPTRFPQPWVAALLLIGSASPASGGALARPTGASPGLDQLLSQLEASYRGVKTLRAEFTQTYTWGERTRVESGTVTFARRGLMRWEYRQPSEKLYVSDGRTLLLYIPEERQLTRSAVRSSEDIRVPFRLLLSRVELRKLFSRIEFADRALAHPAENRVLRGYPKRGAEDDFREVLIEVTPAFDIRRLVVLFPDRSGMEFRFERVERNVAVSPSLFRFAPPPGTEVIEQK